MVEVRTMPAAEPREKSLANVLRHAALVIEERGWTTGEPVSPTGKVCAWGGIRVAVYGDGPADDPADIDVEAAATAVLAGFVRTYQPTLHDESDGIRDIGAVAAFNDAAGRTAEEVTAALRAAADAWDAVPA